MTDHRIIAADWQIKAAQRGRLGAVIVPLEQYFSHPITKVRHNGLGTAVYSNDFNMGFVHNLFSAGDRLYLAEQWCEYDDEYILRIEPDCEVSDHEDSWLSWQPAETMPPEAAQYWFEVAGVRVMQMKNISLSEIKEAFLFHPLVDDLGKFSETTESRWNAAHPEHPWSAKRWVVVMEVMEVAN
jgi:hypothetical protein